MKFKSTTKQPKALLYKRFIGLEKSMNFSTIFCTSADGIFWVFDKEKATELDTNYHCLAFMPVSSILNNVIPTNSKTVNVESYTTILQYKNTYYRYAENGWWQIFPVAEVPPILTGYDNISKYQTNKYYYVGSFDFMIKGSIEGTNAQFIPGNIIPLSSFNIKYFNDDIQLNQDDLVVIDKHLYSVENPETDIKYNPKPYKIHFATLNSIL